MKPSSAKDLAFTPLQIGPLKLRNRFIKSATNEGMAKAACRRRCWSTIAAWRRAVRR